MAHEELMQLPSDVELVTSGPFCVRTYGGSESVVVLTDVIVTCGGEDSRTNALDLAARLNEAFEMWLRDKAVQGSEQEGEGCEI